MTGDGIICRLTKVSAVEGADRIVRADILGETVIVSKDQAEGTMGVLFDIETQLSPEFLHENNLFRHSELNKDTEVKGYFDDNGRVRPIKLKGIKVSAFWTPLDSLAYLGHEFKEGDLVSSIGKREICRKFRVVRQTIAGTPKTKVVFSEMFKEHFKTEHLLKSLPEVPIGPFVITTKLHGTSGRYGKLLVNRPLTWWEKIYSKFTGYNPQIWRNIVGSRTVVKSVEGLLEGDGGFYSEDIWSKASTEVFGDRLHKGETVYFEIVGYIRDKPIMPTASVVGLKSMLSVEDYGDIKSKYGDVVNYTYGCRPGQYDVYVYRITHTTVDGDSIELSWDQVKARCVQLDVKHVPELMFGERLAGGVFKFDKNTECTVPGYYYPSSELPEAIECISNQAAHLDTFPEGICIRTDSYPKCKIWKYKCYNFRIVEFGLIDKGVESVEDAN